MSLVQDLILSISRIHLAEVAEMVDAFECLRHRIRVHVLLETSTHCRVQGVALLHDSIKLGSLKSRVHQAAIFRKI